MSAAIIRFCRRLAIYESEERHCPPEHVSDLEALEVMLKNEDALLGWLAETLADPCGRDLDIAEMVNTTMDRRRRIKKRIAALRPPCPVVQLPLPKLKAAMRGKCTSATRGAL